MGVGGLVGVTVQSLITGRGGGGGLQEGTVVGP